MIDRDEIRKRYAAGEAATDSLLERLRAKPWTLVALGAVLLGAVAFGAWLF